MAESNAKSIFGIHDIRFVDRDTYESVAHYRVLGDVTIDMPAEFAELKGGSNLFLWDSAVSSFKPTCSITAREISADIMTANLSATVTEYATDTDGDVIHEANKNGTSIINATTGIATITLKAGDEADAKEGWYMIKCPTNGATVNVYALSSANFDRGTDGAYSDDDGLITASPITITASTGTELANYGLTLTGGSGTIGFTAGDTAIFYVQAPHTGAYSAVIGSQPMQFEEYACVISSETNNGMIYNILLYRVKPAGMSLPFKEKGFGEFNINMAIMYDSTAAAVGIFKASQTS